MTDIPRVQIDWRKVPAKCDGVAMFWDGEWVGFERGALWLDEDTDDLWTYDNDVVHLGYDRDLQWSNGACWGQTRIYRDAPPVEIDWSIVPPECVAVAMDNIGWWVGLVAEGTPIDGQWYGDLVPCKSLDDGAVGKDAQLGWSNGIRWDHTFTMRPTANTEAAT